MQLVHVPISHIDQAWKDGAHQLSEACDWAAAELTPGQLKMLLSRGEKQLIGLQDEGLFKAWAAIEFQQLPNIRVLFVYAIYARGSTGERAFELLADLARSMGCSSIRGACSDEIARLWQMKFRAKKVYNVLELPI